MKPIRPKLPLAEMPRKAPSGKVRRIARRLFRFAGVGLLSLLLIYALLLTYMVKNEKNLVYLPARPDEEWHDKPSAAIQDIFLKTSDGVLHGWYLPAPKAKAAFLICHGQAGNLTARGTELPGIVDRFHTSTLIFDYPGYGISEGEPSEAGCYAAADAAFDWLVEQKQFRPEQIIIYGESLGGGVAVDVASRHKHAALLLVNTFTSLPEVAQGVYPWIPVNFLMTNRFDSSAKIARCQSPIFITHGTDDRLIPIEQSRRLFDQMTAPKKYLSRMGMDHTDPLSVDALNQIRDFLIQKGCIPPG